MEAYSVARIVRAAGVPGPKFPEVGLIAAGPSGSLANPWGYRSLKLASRAAFGVAFRGRGPCNLLSYATDGQLRPPRMRRGHDREAKPEWRQRPRQRRRARRGFGPFGSRGRGDRAQGA